jgi:L-alanine-DL-glutamate epimerase-like enolase superfamily enzyme
MVVKMEETPWPIYKIKLGTKDDLQIVTELRKHTDAIFRIDANCAWGVEETIQNSRALKVLGVEFLEQPLPAENWKGSRKVFLNTELPIIADESCQIEADVEKCNNHFHGINIKLVKCGGLTSARRMIQQAKSFKMKTMDGAMLLSNDIATGITMDFGMINYSSTFGTGVKLIDENPKSMIL